MNNNSVSQFKIKAIIALNSLFQETIKYSVVNTNSIVSRLATELENQLYMLDYPTAANKVFAFQFGRHIALASVLEDIRNTSAEFPLECDFADWYMYAVCKFERDFAKIVQESQDEITREELSFVKAVHSWLTRTRETLSERSHLVEKPDDNDPWIAAMLQFQEIFGD